ncbi:MAG: ribonuclease E/G [Sporolactobacillus sp.]
MADQFSLIIDCKKEETVRAALLQNGEVLSFYLLPAADDLRLGDLYLAEVSNERLKSVGWFLKLGGGLVGFLPRNKALDSRKMSPGTRHLVQIEKEAYGHKKAQLTEYIQISGRGLIYLPRSNYVAVSREIDQSRREFFKKKLAAWCSASEGVIVRTQAQTLDAKSLQDELQNQRAHWQRLLHEAGDKDVPRFIERPLSFIASILNENHCPASCTIRSNGPLDLEDLPREASASMASDSDLFEQEGIEPLYQSALHSVVPLPIGGSLVINYAEALTAIDVNSGSLRFEADWEEQALRINAAAARMAARQLRLREIGGMVVIDFLRLNLAQDRDKVLQILRECLMKDTATVKLFGYSAMGLVELTRKKRRYGLQDFMKGQLNV